MPRLRRSFISMWFWLISSALAFLVLTTLLPLWQHPAWWVRGWDFPRLQLAILAVGLLALEFSFLDRSATHTQWMLGLTAACLAYQVIWIFPYTPFYRREVRNTDPRQAKVHLRLMAANVLTPNRRSQDFLNVVRAWRPDVLVTVETDERWERELQPLLEEYPHTLCCPLDNLYGMHLYSRLPLEDPKIQFLVEDDKPSMHTLVRLPQGRRIELHCLHPAPPSPTENETSSERDAELVMVGRAVADSRFPVVVTGDLNDVAWSATTRLFRKLSGLLDPRIGRGMYNTFHASWPIFRWPVDHIFHSTHFTLTRIQRLPPFGSDHFAVGVDLALGEPDAGEQAEDVPDPDPEDFEEAREKTDAEGVSPRQVHRPGQRRARHDPPAPPERPTGT